MKIIIVGTSYPFRGGLAAFNERLAGNPIRRIGHRRWLRNLAVALGNAPRSPRIVEALEARRSEADAILLEHLDWALARQRQIPG